MPVAVVHNVQRQTQLVLTGAGNGHGLACQFGCFFLGIAIIQVALDAVLVELFLIFLRAVGRADRRLHAGSPAVGDHIKIIPVCNGGDLIGIIEGNQFHSVIFRQKMPGIDQMQELTIGGKILGHPIDCQRPLGGGAVRVEVVHEITDLIPARGRNAGLIKIVQLISDIVPAGKGTALLVRIVAFFAYGRPPVCQVTLLAEQICLSLYFGDACAHCTVGTQIVLRAVQIQPAGLQDAAGIQIIPAPVNVLPAGAQQPVGTEVIAAPVDVLPAGHGVAVPIVGGSGLIA